MYIRYNNSSPQSKGQYQPPKQGHTPPRTGQNQANRQRQNHSSENHGNPQGQSNYQKESPPKRDKEPKLKNPLKFLPEEIYNPNTHKFFGRISGEDILLIGLILMVLDSGCDDDLILALALFYILLSDYLDFGNILF